MTIPRIRGGIPDRAASGGEGWGRVHGPDFMGWI